MKNVITTFQCFKTMEGQRISYAYSEVGEDGSLKSTNNRDNLIVLDEEIQKHIDAINEFLSNRVNSDK